MIESLLIGVIAFSFSARTPKDTTVDKLDYQLAGKIKGKCLSIEAESERQNAIRYNNYKARGQAKFLKVSWELNEAHNIDRQEITAKLPYSKGVYSAETGLSCVWHGLNTTGNPTAYLKHQIAYKGLKSALELYPDFHGDLESIKFKTEYKYQTKALGKFYFKPLFVWNVVKGTEYIQGKIEIGMEL